MRRRPWSSFLVALALALSLGSASTLAQDGEPDVYRSQDGLTSLVTVEVPQGAAPADASIELVTRDAAERPAELADLPMQNDFHELRPVDLRFDQPVRVTRLVEFPLLGFLIFDPAEHGMIVAPLFTRDAEGVWSWMDRTEVRVDTAEGGYVVTALTGHGGPIFGLIAANLLLLPQDPPETAVGEGFRIEGQLRVAPGVPTEAEVAAASGSTSDPAIAAMRRLYDVATPERAAGVEFECLAPGTVSYEVTFSVTDVADVSALSEPIGLEGTDVDVTYAAEHTCLE